MVIQLKENSVLILKESRETTVKMDQVVQSLDTVAQNVDCMFSEAPLTTPKLTIPIGHQISEKERTTIQWISDFDFDERQKELFAKHHHGTGDWLLHSTQFQKWAYGKQSSTLWCPGIRTVFLTF